MRKKRSGQKKKNATIDYCQLMDLDLDQFFVAAVRDRALFPILDSLAKACQARADSHDLELQKTDLHPAVRVLAEDAFEFFDAAAQNVRMASDLLKTDWRGRELPMCADGALRFTTERAFAATQSFLETLIGTINDPDATEEERSAAAARLATQAGTVWTHNETGEPNLDVAKAFDAAVLALVDANTSDTRRREIAAGLQEFIFTNGERRAHG